MTTINENTVKGKWKEIKGDIQSAWGKLTDNELETTKGDIKQIGGLIQQRYGEAEEKYGKKLSDIFNKFKDQKDQTVDSAKNSIKNTLKS